VPNVFTDGNGNINPMDANNQSLVPCYKVSKFIKDAVIGQMALYISGLNFSIMNNCNCVLGSLV